MTKFQLNKRRHLQALNNAFYDALPYYNLPWNVLVAWSRDDEYTWFNIGYV